ncbi:hypothetical protein SAMN04489712_1436 [Thermomonospora echinospora]|uniref:DUF6545 domain-containing protein n=1 Tax=Thermomonospora echinospora TaxID=1992 RepID=A0A1H6E8N3_9ACTN|nr:hypothetical protein SAMN04489712_1436 [Thermomonospora echinospora]
MNHLYYLLAATCWTAAAYKARDLRRAPASPALQGTCLTLGLLGLAFLVLADSSRTVIDRVAGVEDLARWVGNSCTLAAGCSIQIVLAHFTRAPGSPAPDIRPRIALLAGAVIPMGVLMLTEQPPDCTDFVNVHAHRGPVVAYLLIYLSYLGLVMADALRLSWRYAPHAGSGPLRLGLRLIAVGSSLGLLYCLYKAAFALCRFWGLPTIGTEGVVGPALGLLAALLIVAGLTVGAWGAALTEHLQRWRSYRRLEALWRPLVQAVPQVVLPTEQQGVAEKLYRRVIEIRDAQLALSPYRDDAFAVQARRAAQNAGLTGQDLEAAVEGTVLAAALAAKRLGRRSSDAVLTDMKDQVGPDLASEVAWLEKVTVAFISPLVPPSHVADSRATEATGR